MPRIVLSDVKWERIAAFLPSKYGMRGSPSANSRAIVEGIRWRIRTGAPWCDLPKEFGSWSLAGRNAKASWRLHSHSYFERGHAQSPTSFSIPPD
jgi:transposase